MIDVAAIVREIESVAPSDWAEEWDNVGLQIGNPHKQVDRVAVALEATHEVVEEVTGANYDLLVTHHPLIFSPLYSVNEESVVGGKVSKLLSSNTALYCAHTNLDRSDLGPSAYLANELALKDTEALQPMNNVVKLVVFVPENASEDLRWQLGEAKCGAIGSYSHCTFSSSGEGTFKVPGDGKPYVGEAGEFNRVDEVRLETIFPRHLMKDVLKTLYEFHPYEEPAYDIYGLKNENKSIGMGRIGRLPEPVAPEDLLNKISALCTTDNIRIIGEAYSNIETLAICGGSGEKLWKTAHAMDADIYITGDISYHSAREIAEAGFCTVDAGHASTEKPVIRALSEFIEKMLADCDIQVDSIDTTDEPW